MPKKLPAKKQTLRGSTRKAEATGTAQTTAPPYKKRRHPVLTPISKEDLDKLARNGI